MGVRMKIAVIGTGISGMGIASLLHPYHDLTIYEKNATIGGHSRTIEATTSDGIIPVDTGFIVFNHRNYPLLTKLFEHLKVSIAKSNMSFGASIANGWLEYSMQKPSSIFAQKRNLLRPQFWKMLHDILRFHKSAKNYLNRDPSITLRQCLNELEMGEWFAQYFLLPMGGAIWSSSCTQMLDFPAYNFIRFFENHGLLTVNDQPQWYTVIGGSREYINRLTAPFKNLIRLNCGIKKATRTMDGVMLQDIHGNIEHFDQVIFACHADQALGIIENPSLDESAILGNFRYQKNHVILHSDISFMPKNKKAWASWVYLSENHSNDSKAISLSYWMNQLQPLATNTPLIVTLNPGREPNKALVHDEAIFEHPLFDEKALLSQKEIDKIQGKERFWFCGAYQRYGFHEDGLNSAVELAKKMGVTPIWS